MKISKKPIRRRRSVLIALALLPFGLQQLAAQPFPENYLIEQDAVVQNPKTFTEFGSVVAVDDNRMVVTESAKLHFYDKIDGVWTNRGVIGFPLSKSWFDADLKGDTLAVGRSNSNGDVMVFEESGVRGDALNAWNTTDNTTSTGQFTRYGHAFSAQDHLLANTEGWTLTVRSRLVNDFNGTSSCFIEFANDTGHRFLINFDLNGSDNLTVDLSGSEVITIPSDGTGWANYHTHQIVFDGTLGTADYFFDGEKMSTIPWSPTAIAGLNGIRFGNGTSAGRGSMNWNKIEFKTAGTDQVLALFDAGTVGNTPASLAPLDQDWSIVTSTGTSAGPVMADYHSYWILKKRFFPSLLPTQFDLGSGFGADVALRGDTLFVGYPFDLDGSADAGSVRIFRKIAGEWTTPEMPGQPGFPEMLISTINDQRVWFREFGASLDVDGDTLIVGSVGNDRFYSGQAHVYVEDAGVWELQEELMSVSPLPGFNEVHTVSIQGDLAVVGTPDPNPNQATSGIAQVYHRDGTTWTKVGGLVPSVSVSIYGQMRSAIDGDKVVLGFFDDDPFQVVHHLFAENDLGDWVEADRYLYLDPNGGEQFGDFADMDFDGEHMVVGIRSGEGDGQVVHTFQPYQYDVPALVKFTDELLYYPDAKNSGSPSIDENEAAFRYQVLLYERDLVNGVNPVYDMIGDHFGQPERDRAALAERELAAGLMHNPDAPEIHTSLLDLFYDLARANTVVTRDLIDRAEKAHFGLPIGEPTPASGFIVDAEIPLFQSVLETNRYALDEYFRLFTVGDSGPGQPPLGYTIFQDQVPTRAMMSAEFVDSTNGDQLTSVLAGGTETLFNGFKDAVAAFEMLRDHGRSAATLVELLISRDNPEGVDPSDRDQALMVISDTTGYLLNHGSLVKGMFDTLPPIGDQSGLAETIEGWQGALADLHGLESIANSSQNILGFSDDFHFFVENYGSSAPAELQFFHSFDIFESRLKPGESTSQLELSIQELASAEGSYAGYRGSEDQIASQFGGSTITYRDRLRDIVGVFPEDEMYSDVPTNNPGSLLDQQFRGIEIARTRILRNGTEISNLLEEVAIERDRNSNYTNSVIDYGSQQAALTQEIGNIKATQAAAQAMSEGLSIEGVLSGKIFGVVANAAVQGGGELMITAREVEKEELAAEEQAHLEGINSEARVLTLLLGLKTLAVDSIEQQLLLVQEVGRLADLYREKDDLERKIRERNVSLSRRYFADPVHRLIYQSDMISADLLFGEAQRWLYFMVKAYEYKHNVPLNVEYPGGSGVIWGSDAVFKCRNADELHGLYQAMFTRDNLLNLGDAEVYDAISLREDYFGYKDKDRFGTTLFYPDPISGELVDALTAFRSRLKISTNQNSVGAHTIHLEFSTVRKFPGAPFLFLGPEFDDNGNLINNDAGRYLDKIKSLRVSLPGTHTFGFSSLPGNLTYGGTSFIRNEHVGAPDPEQPNRLVNELTAYGTRYWFIDSSSATERWDFVESRRINGIPIDIIPDGGPAPVAGNIQEFKERSVATSRWELDIPTYSGSIQRIDIDEINDIVLHIWHYSKSRVQ